MKWLSTLRDSSISIGARNAKDDIEQADFLDAQLKPKVRQVTRNQAWFNKQYGLTPMQRSMRAGEMSVIKDFMLNRKIN